MMSEFRIKVGLDVCKRIIKHNPGLDKQEIHDLNLEIKFYKMILGPSYNVVKK